MAPLIMGIISSLISSNLPKVAQAVVDKGLDAVEDKLGIKLEPDMSAEKIAEVQAAAMKHEDFRIEQDNKNTDSARTMQGVALQQDDLFSKRFVYYLATFWSFATAVYIACITFMTIPQGNARFADTVLGFLLGTAIATILNFFFGSSQSSKDKTEAISALVKKA